MSDNEPHFHDVDDDGDLRILGWIFIGGWALYVLLWLIVPPVRAFSDEGKLAVFLLCLLVGGLLGSWFED